MPPCLDDLLLLLVAAGGSDLHVKAGQCAVMRLHGKLTPLSDEVLSGDVTAALLTQPLSPEQLVKLHEERELDFSYELGQKGRFRGNLFWQKGHIGGVFRLIPTEMPDLKSLGLPPALSRLVEEHQGLVLVTGPTGSGKSTTLAAMIDYMNQTTSRHVITIEDPMEFAHSDKSCLINQREVGSDTLSFNQALRRALRQDPDVIVVGEMRDAETIKIAMTAAETGHLVLSTLHTNDAKQTVDRIINSFPTTEHHQVRMQLSLVLTGIVSQRLMRRKDGSGRVAVLEIMLTAPTVRKLIEEGRTQALDKAIEEANDEGMQTMNQALLAVWRAGLVDEAEAIAISTNAGDLRMKIQTETFAKTGTMDRAAYAKSQGLGSAPTRPAAAPGM